MKRLIQNPISKIIICGGRHFDNYSCLEHTMDQVLSELGLDFNEIEIVSGHCSGADQLGERYADNNNIQCKLFPANWNMYGKSAGPIRNSEMIEYISDADIPVVVAFVSPQTRGTLDTVNKAKRKGFHLFVIDYETIESSISIFSGVRLNGDEYNFDFDKDLEGDIVKLTKQHINKTKTSGHTRYFGYKIEKDVADAIKKDFLSWIKTSEGYTSQGVSEMIERCVEEFAENNNTHYDYIIATASSSLLTQILCDKLSKAFNNAPVLSTSKLAVSNLQIDNKKLSLELKQQGESDEYIQKLTDFIQTRYIDPQIKFGRFSMRKVAPKYRKWISPMFKFDDAEKLYDASNILIVDETITTGESINQIITLLSATEFKGQIDIFTLISNR